MVVGSLTSAFGLTPRMAERTASAEGRRSSCVRIEEPSPEYQPTSRGGYTTGVGALASPVSSAFRVTPTTSVGNESENRIRRPSALPIGQCFRAKASLTTTAFQPLSAAVSARPYRIPSLVASK